MTFASVTSPLCRTIDPCRNPSARELAERACRGARACRARMSGRESLPSAHVAVDRPAYVTESVTDGRQQPTDDRRARVDLARPGPAARAGPVDLGRGRGQCEH